MPRTIEVLWAFLACMIINVIVAAAGAWIALELLELAFNLSR